MRGYFGPKGNKTLIAVWMCTEGDMKKIITAAILAIFGVITTALAWAHSGRTDKNGCHMDRKAGTRLAID